MRRVQLHRGCRWLMVRDRRWRYEIVDHGAEVLQLYLYERPSQGLYAQKIFRRCGATVLQSGFITFKPHGGKIYAQEWLR